MHEINEYTKVIKNEDTNIHPAVDLTTGRVLFVDTNDGVDSKDLIIINANSKDE